MTIKNLSAPERFIYEWQYGILGGFSSSLIGAISRADDDNLAKLRLGFPDEVDGYINFSQVNGWWQDVEDRATQQGAVL